MLDKLNNNTIDIWLEDAAHGLPQELFDEAMGGDIKKENLNRNVILTARVWGKDETEVKFRAKLKDTLREVFHRAAKALGEKLLPPEPAEPLDLLHAKTHEGEWSRAIRDLDQPLWLALREKYARQFAVDYKLIVKINAIWGKAPSPTPTPRQLLAAFGMDANEFTLYPVASSEPYPVDTSIKIQRGDQFEAQKDGKYGDRVRGTKPRGSQTIEDDISAVQEAGGNARLLSHNGQRFAHIGDIAIPTPPWDRQSTEILIAVSDTYPTAGLDAFYVKLPIGHSSGDVPKKQNEIQIGDTSWLLISWHYHESRPWNSMQDDLVTHIEHCRGFFLTRGVRS
ncbi:MAG: hypothetical protein IPG58_06635 [Acidobacteria bacterium]|nr:hypothetical protein [Acidobacteriota bacterium]